MEKRRSKDHQQMFPKRLQNYCKKVQKIIQKSVENQLPGRHRKTCKQRVNLEELILEKTLFYYSKTIFFQNRAMVETLRKCTRNMLKNQQK